MEEVVLLDTDAIIELHKERNKKIFLRIKETKTLNISIVTLYEYIFGEAYLGKDYTKIKRSLESVYNIVPLNQEILLKTIELDLELTRRGEKIELRDLIIAATAIEKEIPLVTGNTKHFQRFQQYGLKLVPLETLF